MLIRVPLIFDLTIATTATISAYRSGGDWKRTALEEYGGIVFGTAAGVIGGMIGAPIGGLLGGLVGGVVGAATGAISGAIFADKVWRTILKLAYEDVHNEQGIVQK